MVAGACAVLAFFLLIFGLYQTQQDRLARGAAEAASFTPAPLATRAAEESTTAAFLGDSYTEGAGSTQDRLSRWTTLAARELGWDEKNFGIGGTGYVQGENYLSRVDEVIAANPDIVVVSGGRNDVSAPLVEVQANATEMFAALREGLPEATIIAVSPWWDASEPPNELTAIRDAVEDAVADANGVFVDAGQPLAGQSALLSDDGVHPNNSGYDALAEAVIPLLNEAL